MKNFASIIKTIELVAKTFTELVQNDCLSSKKILFHKISF